MVNYRSFISFPSFYMCITLVKMMIPFRRELYAASSRGRYMGTTSAWPVSEPWMKKTQCTWHWQVEAYDVRKLASVGIKGRLWNTSSSFLSSGDICFWSVSTMYVVKRFRRYADPCQRFLTPDDTWHMHYVFGRKAHTLCSRGNRVRSLWAFLFGKAPLLFVPFLKRIWAIICPPRLGSSHCWSWGSLADEFERGINFMRSSAADEDKLLEEDVLLLTSSDPAGSALLTPEQEWADEGEEDVSCNVLHFSLSEC